MELTTKRLSIVPTMRCTLNCRLCSNHMPDFKQPPADATVRGMMRDIDLALALFDHISWLQFVGGEIFLHPGMAEVYEYCYTRKDEFDKLIIETNATLKPRDAEIATLTKFGDHAEVMISDYGELSYHRDDFVALLEKHNIPYRLKHYFGETEGQHFGGWIDNTGMRDYRESDGDVIKKAAACAQARLENMHMFCGKLHRCSNSLFMTTLGVLTPNEGDFVDIRDDTIPREKKREIIGNFYKYPRKSCHYCRWKNMDDADAIRYPAAQQAPRRK